MTALLGNDDDDSEYLEHAPENEADRLLNSTNLGRKCFYSNHTFEYSALEVESYLMMIGIIMSSYTVVCAL